MLGLMIANPACRQRVMGKELGSTFQAILEKKGVKFYMNSEIEDALPSGKYNVRNNI